MAGLYIHIPFCYSKCDYCDFFSKTNAPIKTIKATLDKTLDQFIQYSKRFKISKFDTVFIGGGTPNSLPLNILFSFLQKLRDELAESPKEWSIEANPGQIDSSTLRNLNSIGINRLSLGVQSLNTEALSAVSRNPDSVATPKSLQQIKNAWPGIVNFDVLAGLPGDTTCRFLQNLESLLQLEPEHISLYGLTLEPGTPLESNINTGKVKLPGDEVVDSMLEKGRQLLTGNGFIHYETSNYCKPGFPCRHNLCYWRSQTYLGCGPSAVSTVYNGKSVLRLSSLQSIEIFNNKPDFGVKEELISETDQVKEFFLMGLRLRSGVTNQDCHKRFEKYINELIPKSISIFQKKGYLSFTNKRLCTTKKGVMWLNQILVSVFDELDQKTILT